MMKNVSLLKITDICHIERTKKGEVYKSGTVYLQVSATHGQILITGCDTELEAGKYVVFIPFKRTNTKYLQITLRMSMEEFIARYMTGINIQVEMLQYLKVWWHNDPEDQEKIVEAVEKCDKWIEHESVIIQNYKELKKNLLNKMFV